jgi:predicted DNA repair protein MutK
VVIDDAAVTPRYVIGFAASRELPIVAKIAMGSLRNKLLFLMPAALALVAFHGLRDHIIERSRRDFCDSGYVVQ